MEDTNFGTTDEMDFDIFDFEIDFEPAPRSRSNTWPVPRPENYLDSNILTDESSKIGSVEHVEAGRSVRDGTPGCASEDSPCKKKPSRQKNPWGDISYAELITQAINSTEDRRLTLSQIYDWLVKNVPFFKDKSENKSNAGWKNSVRHNLSLHNRFIRIPNETPGRSSWWTINPDPKFEKTTRRRSASMEAGKLEKKRALAKKQADSLRKKLLKNESLSASNDFFDEIPSTISNKRLRASFRPRASSCTSSFKRLNCIPRIPEEQNYTSIEYYEPMTNENVLAPNDYIENNVEFSNEHLQAPFRPRASSCASSFGRLNGSPLIQEQTFTANEFHELPVNENLTTSNHCVNADVQFSMVNENFQETFRSRVSSCASSIGGMSSLPQFPEEPNCTSIDYHELLNQPQPANQVLNDREYEILPMNEEIFIVSQNLTEVNNICFLHPVGACTCINPLEVNSGTENSSDQSNFLFVNVNDSDIYDMMPTICTNNAEISEPAMLFHKEGSNVNYNDFAITDQADQTNNICALPRNNSMLDDINEIIKKDIIDIEKVNDSISTALFISNNINNNNNNNNSMINFQNFQ